jgi:hypothetical protein
VQDDLRLICFPVEDEPFAALVRAVVSDLGQQATSEPELLAAVHDTLRRDYPNVRIRTRDPIAEYWPEQAIWYVYRDGRPAGDERGPGDNAGR